MLMKQIILQVIVAFIALFFLAGCLKDDFPFPGQNRVDIDFYGLTTDSYLMKFNAKKPQQAIESIQISGLQNGEEILAIDFRPATGQLYGLGSSNRLYFINLTSGMATAVGTSAFSPALNGTIVGFDFNPTVDRIRVVTAKGQNFRLNPETGAVAATDMNLNPGTPAVSAVAYTNSFAGAASTILYDIDMAMQKLFRQDPPNNGTLIEVGALNENVSGEGGFDISPDNKTALAALRKNDKNSSKYFLYSVDLASGKLDKLGAFDEPIIGLAIPSNPVAYGADQMNNLLIFNPEKPASTISKAITGLQSGEYIIGIDMRPATGQLYALGSTNRLYTINMSSGAATAVNATAFAMPTQSLFYGFDFNPTVDRIRVVASNGQNLRLHPVTGVIAGTDMNLNPGTPSVSAAAYTNNFPGATATVLYDIDFAANKLFTQNPPNNGTLVEAGALGIDVEAANGFDIGGSSGTAYALLTVNGKTGLYSINLSTAKAKSLGSFTVKVNGLAVGLGF